MQKYKKPSHTWIKICIIQNCTNYEIKNNVCTKHNIQKCSWGNGNECNNINEKLTKYCEQHNLFNYLEQNPDKKITDIEKENGVILKRSKNRSFNKYKLCINKWKIVCCKKNCYLFVIGRSKYCSSHYESNICGWNYGYKCNEKATNDTFFCDEHIIKLNEHNETFSLTEYEKQNNITLEKNSIGFYKKYKYDGILNRKVCLEKNCIKYSNNNNKCILHSVQKYCECVNNEEKCNNKAIHLTTLCEKHIINVAKCDKHTKDIIEKYHKHLLIEYLKNNPDKKLTEEENKNNIILRLNSKNEYKKYKEVNNKYTRICSIKNCLFSKCQYADTCQTHIKCKWNEEGKECENYSGIEPYCEEHGINIFLNNNPDKKLTEYEIKNNIILKKGYSNTQNIYYKYRIRNDGSGIRKVCNVNNCINFTVNIENDVCHSHGGFPLCIKCKSHYTKKQSGICGICNLSKLTKKKENEIAELLTSINYPICRKKWVYNYNHDRYVKPDFLYDIDDYHIIVEVDEYQHKKGCYSPEEERNREQFIRDGLQKPCIFIRYNPDAYKINGITKRTTKVERHKQLLEKIMYWFNNKPEDIKVEFLFYDTSHSEEINI